MYPLLSPFPPHIHFHQPLFYIYENSNFLCFPLPIFFSLVFFFLFLLPFKASLSCVISAPTGLIVVRCHPVGYLLFISFLYLDCCYLLLLLLPSSFCTELVIGCNTSSQLYSTSAFEQNSQRS